MARLNPTWRYEEIADVGHVPHLEMPGRTVELVEDWLATDGEPAARAARAASARGPLDATGSLDGAGPGRGGTVGG
jgi:hypothetical protein